MGAIEGHLRHRQLQQQVYFVSGTRLGIPKTDTDTALVLHTRIHTHTHVHAHNTHANQATQRPRAIKRYSTCKPQANIHPIGEWSWNSPAPPPYLKGRGKKTKQKVYTATRYRNIESRQKVVTDEDTCSAEAIIMVSFGTNHSLCVSIGH